MSSSFDVDVDATELTVREAVRGAIREEMATDERVVLAGIDIGSDGGPLGVLEGMVEEFGENRVRNTPISETAIVGTGVGAALTGMRPVVEIMYSAFLGEPMDQILNQVSKSRYMFGGAFDLPLTIRTQNTMGFNAGAQHSQALHHLLAGIPGIRVVCVSTPYDAKGLLTAAIRADEPVVVFEHSAVYDRSGPVPDAPYELDLGRAAVERPGEDVTVVATQQHLWHALEAAREFEGEAAVEVVSPRSMAPLDVGTIAESARKTGRVVVVDDTPERLGMQSQIASEISEAAFFDLDFPVQRVGVKNVPVPFSPPLEDEIVATKADIVDAIDRLV